MKETITLNRGIVIRAAHDCELGSLLALVAIAMHTWGGSSLVSLGFLAQTMGVERHTMKNYVRMLAEHGFITESGTRTRKWRRIVRNDSDNAISIWGAAIERHIRLADGFALLLLMGALATDEGTFVADMKLLCELASCSYDTLLKHIRTLEDANLVERTRVSRSEFRFRLVDVLAGTSEKTTNVLRANQQSLHEMALAALVRLKN